MQRKRLRWIVLGVLPVLGACNLLTPLVFIGEPKKKIAPEFDKLANNRVAIHVWTDAATLFNYPHARFELATYIGDKLAAEMAQRELGTMVVDPRDVEDFLQKDIDAQIDSQAVGGEFDADYVIYLEVLEFQIRDSNEPQFLRGRISASVSVHDMRADPDEPARYELAPITCEYPEGPPVIFNANNSPLIREVLYRKFAEQVARKFYEHTVEMS